ncbi:hypothetical protein NKH73_10415 [Mesorhizobium sp. M0938]|uniref:hypothetical protein n=1 Tax=unclassified Mesorhizobium TaxID=325217 RepID=UPI003338932A
MSWPDISPTAEHGGQCHIRLLGCTSALRYGLRTAVAGYDAVATLENALNSVAAEMKFGRSDLIRIVLREWLETSPYLPMREIDEENETDGSA